MAFAVTCACGRPADSFGGLCDRCVALQTLGLPPTASDEQVENTYRTLVKVWHPDRFQGDQKTGRTAEEKLKEINAAHEFLLSGQGAPDFQREASGEKRPMPPVDRFRAPQDSTPSPAPQRRESESNEVRRILRRRRRLSAPKLLIKLGFTAGALVAIALLWLMIDAILSSNRKTAADWDQYKAEVSRDVHAGVARLSGATENLHNGKDGTTPSETAPTPALVVPPANATASGPGLAHSGPPHNKASGSGKAAQPYVTSGLTPMEVLAVLGQPTSSSGEKMLYKGSEIDFRDGHVVGWKIDSGSPIRVKLWPEEAPTPGIAAFAIIGSSKSDVIALQGTPTFFSDNKFGYGSSEVLFQNGRVVGWKEAPGSVVLRVAH